MTINKMEMIDAQCFEFYGHTNWVFLSTLSDDVIESFKSLNKESDDKSNLVLNRTELIWLVEYERMIEEAEISLPVEQ